MEKERIELSIEACKATVIPFNYIPNVLLIDLMLDLEFFLSLVVWPQLVLLVSSYVYIDPGLL